MPTAQDVILAPFGQCLVCQRRLSLKAQAWWQGRYTHAPDVAFPAVTNEHGTVCVDCWGVVRPVVGLLAGWFRFVRGGGSDRRRG